MLIRSHQLCADLTSSDSVTKSPWTRCHGRKYGVRCGNSFWTNSNGLSAAIKCIHSSTVATTRINANDARGPMPRHIRSNNIIYIVAKCEKLKWKLFILYARHSPWCSNIYWSFRTSIRDFHTLLLWLFVGVVADISSNFLCDAIFWCLYMMRLMMMNINWEKLYI